MDRGVGLYAGDYTEYDALVGQRVTLRFLCADYIPAYLQAYSPCIQSLLHVADRDAELIYLNERIIKQSNGKTFFFCVFDNQDNAIIGAIEIRDVHEHSGQLYTWMNEQYWGNGRYQEAISIAAQTYFALTAARYFTAHVDATNKRSYHALRKANFAPWGIFDGPYGKQYTLIRRADERFTQLFFRVSIDPMH